MHIFSYALTFNPEPEPIVIERLEFRYECPYRARQFALGGHDDGYLPISRSTWRLKNRRSTYQP